MVYNFFSTNVGQWPMKVFPHTNKSPVMVVVAVLSQSLYLLWLKHEKKNARGPLSTTYLNTKWNKTNARLPQA